MIKKYALIVCFLFFSLMHSLPIYFFKDYEKHFVNSYCFGSTSYRSMSWICAYYFAFKKDLFKRHKIKHPNSKNTAQEELWRDALTAQRLLILRGQLDLLKSEYKHKKNITELSSYDDCFNLHNEYALMRNKSLRFPCVKLVNEFMEEVRKFK